MGTRAVLGEDLVQLRPVDDLLVEQALGDRFECRSACFQDAANFLGGVVDDLARPRRRSRGRLLAVSCAVAASQDPAQESRRRSVLERSTRPSRLMPNSLTMRRAIVAGLLQVAGGAVGDLAVDQLLGHRAAQATLIWLSSSDLRHQVAIVVGPAAARSPGRRRRAE